MNTTATGLQYEDTVVGDGAGRVGFGFGKAREVPVAISKAMAAGWKSWVIVPVIRATHATASQPCYHSSTSIGAVMNSSQASKGTPAL